MQLQMLGSLALLVVLASCQAENFTPSSNPPAAEPPPPPAPAPLITLELISKRGWEGITGKYFTDPFAVRLSRAGQGIGGVTITWRVSGGSGEFGFLPDYILVPALTTTNADGVAQIFFRPLSEGTVLISASAAGVEDPVTFAVTAAGRGIVLINFGPTFDCYGYPSSADPSLFSDPQDSIPVGTAAEFVYAPWLPPACSARIVSIKVPPGGTPIDSGVIPAGGRFLFVFDAVGDWEYWDVLNGGTGKVRVR